MKSLSELPKSELLNRAQELIVAERGITMELIEHLREIERRMLYLDLGYSSLFDFTVKHLGLSEGSAQRRISAMRLTHDIPEAKAKMASGELSLSNAAKVQSVLRVTNLNRVEKRELLNKISGLTQKECESRLLELVPDAAPKILERDRQISASYFELKLVVSKELHEKIRTLQALLSHTLKTSGVTELLEHLVDQEIRKQENRRGASRKTPKKEVPQVSSATPTAAAVRTETVRSENRIRRQIPRAIQREVWRRANGTCQHPGCASKYRLEMDHIHPYAIGGPDTIENLRLYCRPHNIQHARETYGLEVVNAYRRI
jgi:5-methylcytosine-specific restriction endonuclease McrA